MLLNTTHTHMSVAQHTRISYTHNSLTHMYSFTGHTHNTHAHHTRTIYTYNVDAQHTRISFTHNTHAQHSRTTQCSSRNEYYYNRRNISNPDSLQVILTQRILNIFSSGFFCWKACVWGFQYLCERKTVVVFCTRKTLPHSGYFCYFHGY